jgi:hypothetical protein
MNRLILVMLLVLGVAVGGQAEKKSKGKYAIVLQAGAETNEGTARAVHALLYACELAENGYTVVLVFDGAGTGWANELRKPENPLHKHYAKVKKLGMTEEICDYCADQFHVKDELPEQQRKLLVGDYEGHPSLVKWIEQGYEVIVL